MKINGITDIPAGMEYISIDRCGDYEHIEIIRNIKKDDRIAFEVGLGYVKEAEPFAERKTE